MKKFLVSMIITMFLLCGSNVFADTTAGDPLMAPLLEEDLKVVDAAVDEDILTYEATTGDFEWHTIDEMIAKSTLADTYLFVGNGSANPIGVVVTGDITINNTGVTAVGADKIKDTMIDWGSGANQADLADIPGGVSGAQVWDFGGATSFELVNSAAPTTDAAGEIALDTTIADHQPLWQYYSGTENMTVVALPTANLGNTDNYIIKYDAATDDFQFEADATAAANPGSFGAETAKTIATGVADASGGENWIGLAGEGAAADDLEELQCAAVGDIIVLSNPNAASYDITIKNGTYMKIGADFTLNNVDDIFTVICSATGANDTVRGAGRHSNGS